ncbi:Fungal specific transcription factor domain containing protein [Neofusicoccum parvum]|uniref:Fungal specific transcription factor domain containing protein n=1 Tax=Neofusicoccum parvum TaxID=310453 RepID=A0ACB5SEJ2_9PEZI|nr:Fungal specific transcription factor domain containing protein [Neofusicoccum parvum]
MHGLDWLVTFSRYSRLVSQIYENLFAINATGKSATAYYSIIDELSANLEAWRASIPEPFRPGAEFRARAFRGPPATTLAIFVQYLYYSVLLALSRATLHVAATSVEHAARHQEGKRLLMRTARSILELTKYIEVETYTPVWVLVFMPLSALFILFDFVVHNPVHPETNSNLALLDIAGGHFSHLEYVSHGTLPASLVAEFAHIARQYVQDFRLQQYQKTKIQATPATSTAAVLPAKATATTATAKTTSKTADEDPGQTLWPVSAASNGLLEYTDPLVFSLGDDSASALTDSTLGIDIMDLFDMELSDIWSLTA